QHATPAAFRKFSLECSYAEGFTSDCPGSRPHPLESEARLQRLATPKGFYALAQGRGSAPWGITDGAPTPTPKGLHNACPRLSPFSIPDVTFVIGDPVFRQEPAEFVLKRHALVMDLLVADVLLDGRNMRGTDRKGTVAGLPVERGESFRFEHFRRFPFQLTNQHGDRLLAGQGTKEMNVIRDATNDERRGTPRVARAREVSVALLTN